MRFAWARRGYVFRFHLGFVGAHCIFYGDDRDEEFFSETTHKRTRGILFANGCGGR
jgi:hypothetical protein